MSKPVHRGRALLAMAALAASVVSGSLEYVWFCAYFSLAAGWWIAKADTRVTQEDTNDAD